MVSHATYEIALRRLFPMANASQRDLIHHLYDPKLYSSAREALYALGTDGYFYCPTRRVVRSVAIPATSATAQRATTAATQNGPSRVFEYIFAAKARKSDIPFLLEGWPNWLVTLLRPLLTAALLPWLGSFHGLNEWLLWADEDGLASLEPRGRALSQRMVAHWSSFIKTGRPLPPWPTSGPAGARYEFDWAGDSVRPDHHPELCAMLDQLRFVWNPPTIDGQPSAGLESVEAAKEATV